MSGLGGLNKSPDGVVIGLVQSQLPVVVTKADLAAQANKICALVTKARKGMPTMDLVVFPEYSLHGLSMDTNPEIMCRLDGPEVAAFKTACAKEKIWGCFSIMEYHPKGNPNNSGIITGEVRATLAGEARRVWGVENNVYQLGHRGFVAVRGGAQDCPYTYVHDLMAGKYRLPWEDEVQVTDGTSCGFPRPTRTYPGQPGVTGRLPLTSTPPGAR